jgi:predicted amidohydrolase YtcJ
MGLKAHDEVLALLEALDPEIDVAAQNWVLCHATTIENQQIDRYKALGFVHTTSMAFGCGEGDLVCRTMGRQVLEHLHPLRHFLDVGMPVGAGTDRGPLSPWAQLELSLTHQLMESRYRNLGRNQLISRLEALAMFTSDAAAVLQWPEIRLDRPRQLRRPGDRRPRPRRVRRRHPPRHAGPADDLQRRAGRI